MFFHGVFLAYYLIVTIATFIIGMVNLIEIGTSADPGNLMINMNYITFTLPFAAIVIDASTKRLWRVDEKNYFSFVKIAAFFYFIGLYLMAVKN